MSRVGTTPSGPSTPSGPATPNGRTDAPTSNTVGAPGDDADTGGTVAAVTETTAAKEPTAPTEAAAATGTTAVTEPKDPRSKRLILALVAVVVVLAIAAGFLVYGWLQALGETRMAAARDAALSGARQAAINLNSVDPNDLDGTFANIQSSITGDELTNGLEQSRSDFENMIDGSGVTVTATAHRAGLSAFNNDDHTAEALVVVDTNTLRPDEPEAEARRITITLDMSEVDGTWRASQIAQLGNAIALNQQAATMDAAGVAPTEDQAAPEGGTP